MKVKLYHGTTIEGSEAIRAAGVIWGRAYLTGCRESAETYATYNDGKGVVIEVEVDVSELEIDMESRNDWERVDIEEAVRLQWNLFTENDVDVSDAKFTSIDFT